MMTRVAGFLVGVSICYACGNGESANEKDSIAGTYVREYSREILNQLSGNFFRCKEDSDHRISEFDWNRTGKDQRKQLLVSFAFKE